jgi:hypothetical protein
LRIALLRQLLDPFVALADAFYSATRSPPATAPMLAGASAAACPIADKVARLGGECRPREACAPARS